jgi:hypothetical protein
MLNVGPLFYTLGIKKQSTRTIQERAPWLKQFSKELFRVSLKSSPA